jgi:protein involved in polysaccharide export with SLBB domain
MRRPLVLAVIAVLAAGCSPPPRPVNLAPPMPLTSLGPGDVFELRIVGEDKLPTTFVVAPDGTVDLPYVKRLKVASLEPQEIAATVHDRLAAGQFLSDATVSVNVKEYVSKRVEILGEVQKPGSISIQPGMTLLRAIALAGGFNAMARKGAVSLRRKTSTGTAIVPIDVEAILDAKIPDVLLQAGDSVFVPQRIA